MKRIFVVIYILTFNFVSFSQETNYSINLIPDSLKENADVVVRYSNQELSIDNEAHAVLKIKEIKTILKKSGTKHAYLVIPYSKFIKIKSIKGKIYDKTGKLIRKIKNKEIIDISNYDGFSLYTDNRLKLIRKPVQDPPYTVEYEYEMSFKGILSFPSWHPVSDYKVSVQNSILKISSSKTYDFRTKSANFKGEKLKKELGNDILYSWEINNIKAIEEEDFSESIENLVPFVLVAPNDFKLDNYKGNAENWSNFGSWINTLNIGRNILPEETVAKIKQLTKNAKTDKEKTKIVYEYMQNKTRYVNISLGIGGWQPFKAEETDKSGYGDCKALSFYTKSLLDAIGVKSHYVLIKAGRNTSSLKTNFPSNQFNHATLCVPNNKDTIWLECTSQTVPFGFIGTFTDDRDAIIIDENGKGKLAHTTAYPEKVNTQIRIANFTVDNAGNILGKVDTKYSGLQYENVNRYLVLSKEDQNKKLDERIPIPNMKIKNFSFDEKKDLIPSINEKLELSIKKYASESSSRIFLVPNIFNRKDYIPKKIANRKSNIIFRRGYIDVDTIKYQLPKNVKIEFIPKNIEVETIFGKYSVKTQLINNNLVYVRKLSLHKGCFPPADYNDLRKFYQTIYKNDKNSIVFVRK